jgi:hypothetical protein
MLDDEYWGVLVGERPLVHGFSQLWGITLLGRLRRDKVVLDMP